MYQAQFSPFRSVAFLRCENLAGDEARCVQTPPTSPTITLLTGSILLDLEGDSFPAIVDKIVEQMVTDQQLPQDRVDPVQQALYKRHRYLIVLQVPHSVTGTKLITIMNARYTSYSLLH